MDTEEEFSMLKRAKSFVHATRGLMLFVRTTQNSWIEIVIFMIAIILGIHFEITNIEWIILVLTGGFVLTAEAFNTAFEIDIDLTSPDMHPYARDTKDVAAGAVLVASITSVIVGLLIFLPYLEISLI